MSKLVLQEACGMVAVVLGLVRKPRSRTHRAVSAEATTRWLRHITWHNSRSWTGVNIGYTRHGQPQRNGHHTRGTSTSIWLPRLVVGAGLGTFGGLKSDIGGHGLRGGSGGRSPGPGGGSASGEGRLAGNGGAKKDEEDFEPAVLNDVARWLRTLRLHKHTPNFEGMT
ncbi:hypothetical protein EDB87DRAFT_1822403 [Lactarius vividus]|nr:hypothetical protein EDB87DRAFT_1822403 [Lactarius vividus]